MSKPVYRVESVAVALGCEPEPDDVVAALSERDYRVFETEQPAGGLVPYHAHEEDEIVVVLDGRMNFNVEEEIVPVGKGEMIVIRAEAVHAAAPVGARAARLLIAFGAEKQEPGKETEREGGEDDSLGS